MVPNYEGSSSRLLDFHSNNILNSGFTKPATVDVLKNSTSNQFPRVDMF